MFGIIVDLFRKFPSLNEKRGARRAKNLVATLNHASRRNWKIEKFAENHIYIKLLTPVRRMETEIYREYLKELNGFSTAFFIENGTTLKCQIKPDEIKRLISIVSSNELKFQKLINDATNPD